MARLIGGSNSATLRDALKAVAKKRDMMLQQVIQEQIDLTIDDLRVHTPIDTGAAAGTINGARRNMYKSHPGYGMKIGNNEGDTGWQPFKATDTRRWSIAHPLWVDYVRKLNYEHPTQGNFLENAVMRLRQRLQNIRTS